MRQKSIAFAIISVLFVLSSCDPTVKRYLGIERKAPDEYSVIKSSPLSIPPNFDLTTPDHSTQSSVETVNKNSDTEHLTENDKIFLKKTQNKPSQKQVKNKIDHK